MTLHFTCTLDDYVELALMSHRHSARFKWTSWKATFLACLVIAAITFFLSNDWIFWRLVRGSLILGGGLIAYHLWYKWIYSYSVRGALETRYGRDNLFDFEVTVDENGVLFQQSDKKVQYLWRQIARAKESNENVEIWSKSGILGIVRGNAFKDDDIRRQFISEINRSAKALAPNGN